MEDVYICPECGRFVDYAGTFILPQNVDKESVPIALCYECRKDEEEYIEQSMCEKIEQPHNGELF